MKLTLTASGDELRKKFFLLETGRDVADLLEVEYGRLVYHIYKIPEEERYTTYDIAKKNGGVRRISAPATALKIIQRKLNQVLHEVYKVKPSVFGFARERSILGNAKEHLNRKYVLNVDLKDFFPSINFGRVRGMLMGIPYKLPEKAATVLAQICCVRNELPQGAPTSPIVSNMICAKMDSQLQHLAAEHRSFYTRYADDITFSTSTRDFPHALAKCTASGNIQIGRELKQIIKDNGFEINSDKVKLRTRHRRQEVTGLTVNEFPNVQRKYVRRIRAMLYAWQKFGLDAAEREFHEKYDRKHRNPAKQGPPFAAVLVGKIGYLGAIRGKRNKVYRGLAKRLKRLSPESVALDFDAHEDLAGSRPLIVTEGKSDWKHLKSALAKLKQRGLYMDLDIEFDEYEHNMGDERLHNRCKHVSMERHNVPHIYVFDRDNKKIMGNISDANKEYKSWDNNVFSFVLPVPEHRSDTPDISIEFFYKDSDIKRQDGKGRRLFLSNEFEPQSGRHKQDNQLYCRYPVKKGKPLAVIDSGVYNRNGESVALTKDDFAKYVLNRVENFNDPDVSEFSKIFDVISKIIEENRRDDS